MEYVATIGSAIRELGEIELEQLAPVGRDERHGDLRPGKCSLDGLRRRSAHDHRTPFVVSGAKRRVVLDGVEDECVVELELAFDGDLRDAPAARPEPALPHSAIEPPGSTDSICAFGASRRSSSGVPGSRGNVPQWP